MLIPLIVPRGYSLDASSWSEWFTLKHEQYGLHVQIRQIEKEAAAEIKVETTMFGIPVLRGVFSYGDSESNMAGTHINLVMLPMVEAWLKAGFDVETVHKAAPLLMMSRSMGAVYLTPEQQADTMKFQNDRVAELQIAQEHLFAEQSGAYLAPDRYSSFQHYIDEFLDMDKEIPDEQ